MRNLHHEQGNILVTSLLILMVMNLLGIGLANVATKEWGVANYETISSEVFSSAEGCTQDVVTWFGTQTATPAAIATFTGSPAENLATIGQDTNTELANKLSGYSYSCNVTYIISKQATSSQTSGGEIGNSGGSYSSGGNLVPKDYYTIVSTGAGPKNTTKVINTIISVEY